MTTCLLIKAGRGGDIVGMVTIAPNVTAKQKNNAVETIAENKDTTGGRTFMHVLAMGNG